MIRLLIVDDHPIVREGLVTVLGDLPDVEVAGTAGSAAEAVAQAGRTRPDVVLLDLELPGADGAAAIPDLLRAAPDARVLVFTAYNTDDRVLGAVRAGARGYLLKGVPGEEIARAIRIVHGGGSYLEPQVAARVLAQVRSPSGGGPVLTARETEVLRLLATGLPNKQIARSLGITERTVKFHVSSLLHKLGAESRTQAASIALQRGLV
jgi:DNA-binding NarL/FixJ family response regulator